MIRRLRPIGAGLHLDVLDGSLFGLTKNLMPEDLGRLNLPPDTTVHIMVKRPGTWLRACAAARIRRVVVHVESDVSELLLREIRRTFQLVLAIAPGTPTDRLEAFLPYAEGLQIMTVRPGRQGRPFQPQQLEIVRKLRQRYPRRLIAVDGGMRTETIRLAIAAGANECVIGSAITNARAPSARFRQILSAAA